MPDRSRVGVVVLRWHQGRLLPSDVYLVSHVQMSVDIITIMSTWSVPLGSHIVIRREGDWEMPPLQVGGS